MSTAKVLGISLLLAIPYLQTLSAMEREEATSEKAATVNENQPERWTAIEGNITKNENDKVITYIARIKDLGLVSVLMHISGPQRNVIVGNYWYNRDFNADTHSFPRLLSPNESESIFYNLQYAFKIEENQKSKNQPEETAAPGKVLLTPKGKPVITRGSFEEYRQELLKSNPNLESMLPFMPNARQDE